MIATGRPSLLDARTKTSHALMTRTASDRSPSRSTTPSSPSRRVLGVDLGLERSLAHRQHPDRHAAVGEDPGRGEEVRVVLLRAEVGHRAHDELVGAEAELGAGPGTVATGHAPRARSTPCTSTSVRSASAAGSVDRTSSDTARSAESRRIVAPLSRRVGRAKLGQVLCKV